MLGRISNLERLLHCPGHGSLVLRDRPSAKRDYAAAWGVLLHTAKEGLAAVPSAEQIAAFPTLAEDLAAQAPWLPELRDYYAGWQHEQALCYDVLTDQVMLGDGTLWGQSVLTGHIDGLLVDQENDALFVDDLKTGENTVELDSPQLLGYTLAAFLWALGNQRLTRKARLVLSVTHFPRSGPQRRAYLEESGSPLRRYARDVPQEELRAFREELRALVPRVQERELVSGDHCVFCPAFEACPLWASKQKGKSNA